MREFLKLTAEDMKEEVEKARREIRYPPWQSEQPLPPVPYFAHRSMICRAAV